MGYPQHNDAPYIQPQPSANERYADTPAEPTAYGTNQNLQQANGYVQGQYNPRQYSSLREAAEAAQANNSPMSGPSEQPTYYPPYTPVQQPHNGYNANDKKAGLSDVAQNMVQKAASPIYR